MATTIELSCSSKQEPEAKVMVPLEAGVQLIAVDWSSKYGPTAPGPVRVRKAGTK